MARIGEARTVRQRYTPAQALLIGALARDVDIEVPDKITPYTAALYGSFTGIPFSTRAERLLFAPKLEVLERDLLPRFPAALTAEATRLMSELAPLPPIE